MHFQDEVFDVCVLVSLKRFEGEILLVRVHFDDLLGHDLVFFVLVFSHLGEVEMLRLS